MNHVCFRPLERPKDFSLVWISGSPFLPIQTKPNKTQQESTNKQQATHFLTSHSDTMAMKCRTLVDSHLLSFVQIEFFSRNEKEQ